MVMLISNAIHKCALGDSFNDYNDIFNHLMIIMIYLMI